jgi:hypothetical protein
MMKNTVKLMMTITLVTGLGMSAFIKPAEAQRRQSNTYSQTATDETRIDYQFRLVDTTRDGIFISDQEPNNENLGLFIGAIEDYTKGLGQLTGIRGTRDPFGNLIFRNSFNPEEELLDVGNLEATLVADPYEANKNAIQYTILEQGTSRSILTSTLRSSEIDKIYNFDLEQAINSLSYILTNELLGRSALYSSNPQGRPDFQGSILSNGAIKEEEIPNHTAVPESDTTASLVAVGVLGAGALLKRKLKSA